MEAGAFRVLPAAVEGDVGEVVVKALRAAGLFGASDRPHLRVITGEGEVAAPRGRSSAVDGMTIVVVVADPQTLRDGRGAAKDFVELRRTGETWEVSSRGRRFSVRNSVGMAQLVTLLRNPGCEIDAATLGGRTRNPRPTIDPLIDPVARAAYREHIEDLRREIERAQADGDIGRVEHLRTELRFVAEHLAAATGLSGTDRSWTCDDERARVAVTKAIRRAIASIGAQDESLGVALDAAVETGRVCVFNPLFEVRVLS